MFPLAPAPCSSAVTRIASRITRRTLRQITVTIQDETKTVTGRSCDSVMQTLEKNGIAVPARCRSGECGFCHSHLLSGKVYVPKQLEYRRLADAQFGCIHPCCSFPLGDLVLQVPAAK